MEHPSRIDQASLLLSAKGACEEASLATTDRPS